ARLRPRQESVLSLSDSLQLSPTSANSPRLTPTLANSPRPTHSLAAQRSPAAESTSWDWSATAACTATSATWSSSFWQPRPPASPPVLCISSLTAAVSLSLSCFFSQNNSTH